MKKTKIICSIGPSCDSWEVFKELVLNGMNVARINFSHSDIENRRKIEDLVKRARTELNANLSILYDTKGPDLRTCEFVDDKIELVKGKKITITEDDVIGTDKKICFNYKNIINKLDIGSRILLDDGFYELIVESKKDNEVVCEIQNSGVIKGRRGVCIPGVNLDMPFISKEDEEDIKYACLNDGDFLALSFVNSKEDIMKVRELCRIFGKPNMAIISKVETQYAIDHIEEIVEVSDYIMVARGDLGVEAGIENLPLNQKIMIDACHKHSKGIIMATQMMNSMIESIRPTNAEVNDVANAVLSGCDAIMTSAETTIGKYPIETVKQMTLICEKCEKMAKYNLDDYRLLGTDIHNTIAKLVVSATSELPIKAVVVSTTSGKTALDIASLRPNAFIVATVTDEKVSRMLSLKWGVYTSMTKITSDTDEIVRVGIDAAKNILYLQKGDLVAIIGSAPIYAHTNFLKIEEI